jgi:hypothetical protein
MIWLQGHIGGRGYVGTSAFIAEVVIFCPSVYTQQPKGGWFISASPIAKETMEYSHYGFDNTIAPYNGKNAAIIV